MKITIRERGVQLGSLMPGEPFRLPHSNEPQRIYVRPYIDMPAQPQCCVCISDPNAANRKDLATNCYVERIRIDEVTATIITLDPT